MPDRLLVGALRDSVSDAESVGDAAGAEMLADIIDGYLGGWVADSNARAALFASERRIRKLRDQQRISLAAEPADG